MTRITIEGLAVSFGGVRVIEGLSLEIPPGAFFTLLGPSGCGKTTLLRTIAGFIAPDAGALRFDDKDMTHVPAHKRGIGMVFQDYALFPDKTVFDNVAYGLRARKIDGGTIKARVGEYLERVGMSGLEARYPAALSGGQRQRVALARALVIEPQVLLMDEPLSNLDARLRVQIRESISDLQREVGITTVFVTHDQEEALALSDRIALMNQGRIEQTGTPEPIYTAPASAFVADFIGAANLLQVDVLGPGGAPDQVRISVEGRELVAFAGGDTPAGKAMLAARPEDLRFTANDDEAVNALPGTILRKRYLGFKTSYRVALASGRVIAVDLHGRSKDAYAEKRGVQVLFDPRTSVVVTR
jgi:iron(III) transport system ATP-binding protein